MSAVRSGGARSREVRGGIRGGARRPVLSSVGAWRRRWMAAAVQINSECAIAVRGHDGIATTALSAVRGGDVHSSRDAQRAALRGLGGTGGNGGDTRQQQCGGA